jgi:hypothetical protein
MWCADAILPARVAGGALFSRLISVVSVVFPNRSHQVPWALAHSHYTIHWPQMEYAVPPSGPHEDATEMNSAAAVGNVVRNSRPAKSGVGEDEHSAKHLSASWKVSGVMRYAPLCSWNKPHALVRWNHNVPSDAFCRLMLPARCFYGWTENVGVV